MLNVNRALLHSGTTCRAGLQRVLVDNRAFIGAVPHGVAAHDYAADYEIVVVYDDLGDLSYLDDLISAGKVKLLAYREPFNFSRQCTVAVIESDADLILSCSTTILK